MNSNDTFGTRWERLLHQWEDDLALPPGLRALVADLATYRTVPDLPPPDLSFLPPMSLAAFVREVGEQVSRDYFPEVSGNLQATADAFFRRLDARRHALLMESPPVYLTQSPDPMTVLTTTYVATARLREVADPALTGDPARFAIAAYDLAVAEAQRHGLNEADADRFAAAFAELVRSTGGMVGRLTIDN